MSTNKMLIDATHPEETRVVVLKNGRVEEFDFESAARKLLRGNIYLAKVTRVEPSLQAAFVDYGGNRHGFLAFNEIHPDYYQIPVADRQALLEEEAAQEAAEEAEVDAHAERLARRRSQQRGSDRGPSDRDGERHSAGSDLSGHEDSHPSSQSGDGHHDHATDPDDASSGDAEPTRTGAAGDHERQAGDDGHHHTMAAHVDQIEQIVSEATPPDTVGGFDPSAAGDHYDAEDDEPSAHGEAHDQHDHTAGDERSEPERSDVQPGRLDEGPTSADVIDETGAEDVVEELPERPRRRPRSYKIQEVIKRRQIILVQIVKEERGNKGAALTTYLSLAGRYTVLMPNTARGGGISRKITQPQDRRRLKAIANELEVPEGMGLIIRTAGAARTAQEIKRDFEYLLRLWESVRQLTLESTAPSLVYEEGNLIKRSIRDLYNKDVEEIVVAGDAAHREAQDFMRMLMPSHAKNVINHKGAEPLFTRYRMEQQLAAMFSPQVTLKSGGYLVINQTEALVAIDVNSGKSTREYSIEETALNTNLEAADELARQLKLRDLAGLIVIDFIDMEEKRNNRAVERRLKDALRFDRARIQLGRISHFGLMEMSRQRLRTGVLEGSTTQCPHCQGTGIIRSVESIALAVIRGLEDALMSGTRMALVATTTPQVALYILNAKRAYITDMEARHGLSITVQGSDKLQGANYTIDKVASVATETPLRRRSTSAVNMESGFDGEANDETDGDTLALEMAPADEDDDGTESGDGGEPRLDGPSGDDQRRKRRRRGRRGRRDDRPAPEQSFAPGHQQGGFNDDDAEGQGNMIVEVGGPDDGEPDDLAGDGVELDEEGGSDDRRPRGTTGTGEGDGDGRRRRRRGRRGGRRNGRERDRPPFAANDQADGDPTTGGGHAANDGDGDRARDDLGGRREPEPDLHGGDNPFDASVVVAEADAPQPPRSRPRDSGEPRPAVARPAAPNPRPERAAEQNVQPVSEPVAVAERPASPVLETAIVEPKPRRVSSTSSEPVLERVVVTPSSGAQSAQTETDASKPSRRGWWQKKLGLE